MAEDTEIFGSNLLVTMELSIMILSRHWPRGMRNVLSGKFRLFFNDRNCLCIGKPAQQSSNTTALDYARTLNNTGKAELLYSISSYLAQRLENKGAGVEMPNVELPSGRKTTTLPPMMGRPVIGYTDPHNPNVTIDVPTVLGPGQGPGPGRQIGGPTMPGLPAPKK